MSPDTHEEWAQRLRFFFGLHPLVKIGLEIPKMIRSKIPRTNGQRDGRHLLL
jgi:hypothetical protein